MILSERKKMTDLYAFAEKYFDWDMNKAVPLGLLLAWLSENHDHGEDGVAAIPSMALEKWAKKVAVTRVVDHGPYGNDKEVWNFFEHGWHKSGCEGRLAQVRARIGDPVSDVHVVWPDTPVNRKPDLTPTGQGGYVVEGELSEDIAKQVQSGFTAGYSVGTLDVDEETNTTTKEDE
jgi:hypothetical protein